MRLRPIEQMSPGVVTIVGDVDPVLTELLREKIDRVRLQMWNGHWRAALDRLGAIYRTTRKFLSSSCTTDAERIHRFRKHMLALRDYLCRNQVALANYAQDRRNGLRISSALAESAMSHLVNERMGKRQPMRWSAEGAHRLLQVRCADPRQSARNALSRVAAEVPATNSSTTTNRVPPSTLIQSPTAAIRSIQSTRRC
jgi:hypothetical protein